MRSRMLSQCAHTTCAGCWRPFRLTMTLTVTTAALGRVRPFATGLRIDATPDSQHQQDGQHQRYGQ